MSTVLEIQGLSSGYGPMRVLHDLDLSIEPGERVGLIGLNGHGKTTLMRSITGLVGWQSGSILINGVQVGGRRSHGAGRKTHAIARMGVAMMPQGDAIFIGMTVRQHLDVGAYTRVAWRERSKRRQRILDIFPPLADLLDMPVGKLSGGERRMVSLGRGLMVDAKLLLVDEPSLGLAPKISRSVIDALMAIDLGDGAMLLAEQNLALIKGKCNRTIGMHAGELRGGISSIMDADSAQSDAATTDTLPSSDGSTSGGSTSDGTRLTGPESGS